LRHAWSGEFVRGTRAAARPLLHRAGDGCDGAAAEADLAREEGSGGGGGS